MPGVSEMFGKIFDALKNANVSTDDTELYAIAGEEVADGRIDPGLWTKAFVDADGDNAKAQILYIRMRVSYLSKNPQLVLAILEEAELNKKNQLQDALNAKLKVEHAKRKEESEVEHAKRNEESDAKVEANRAAWLRENFKL